ncbi:MAG: DEAD/DEAH box helicase [Deltaproteobacteria bacterium]|nr:DEAD/DEAH box helicase [Deltaproteobacteria bacterium]
MEQANTLISPEEPVPAGFDALPLSPALRAAIDEAGFATPLPVQLAAFPPVRAGRDALIQAPTGTGKTIAFGLPILDALSPSPDGPSFLVLAPTRELAMQVHGELVRLGAKNGVKVALVHGGVSIEPQLAALRGGALGIVGTPGRVLDVFDRVPAFTRGLRVLVLDEADQLLSMGFERDIEAIVQRFPGRYQGIFVSATLPREILRLAERYLREPALVSLADEGGKTPAEIRHEMFFIDPGNRLRDLLRILEAERPENSFIFCNTRDDAQLLAGHLRERGFAVDLLSGELTQSERDRVMNEVREGRVAHLVATDLAARGLDVLHLTHVIHYQFPNSPEQYVHRSGRVGRVGQTGTSIALVGPQDVATLYYLRLIYDLRPIERHLPSDTELARERETELVRGLLAHYGGRPVSPKTLGLLRRLRSHVQGERVLAAILAEHVGEDELRTEARRAEQAERGTAQREAARSHEPDTQRDPAPRASRPAPRPSAPPPRPSAPPPQPAATRPIEPPAPAKGDAADVAPAGENAGAPAEGPAGEDGPGAEARKRRRRRRRRPAGEGVAGASGTLPGEGPAAAGDEPGGDELEDDEPEEAPGPPMRTAAGKELRPVLLNVGSYDGVDGDFLGQWLQGRLALRASELGPVRVRDRSATVSVPSDRVADAIGALSGLRFGGREVQAEESRRK